MGETRHYRVYAGFAGERAGTADLTWGQLAALPGRGLA